MVRSSFCSTLSFTVDSSLGVLVPYVSPHDLYHALTYQQNDFQRFWGRKIEEKKCGWEAKCVSNPTEPTDCPSRVIYRTKKEGQKPTKIEGGNVAERQNVFQKRPNRPIARAG